VKFSDKSSSTNSKIFTRFKQILPIIILSVAGFLAPSEVLAANNTTAGTPVSPYPTLINLSIEWPISGDSNNNGLVTVRYRKTGTTPWMIGLPLRRVPAGEFSATIKWANKHSGSLFDLLPNTSYEIELTLTDTDNSGGDIVQTISATTRAEPVAPQSATIVSVDTMTFSTAATNAMPGTILEMADGDYSGFTVSVNGNNGTPIVFRAKNPGKVTVNGDIILNGRSYVFIEGLIVKGTIKLNSSEGIVVRGSTIDLRGSPITPPKQGIVSYGSGVINGYFADNVVLGPVTWANNSLGVNGANGGDGIELTGPGNVIAYNYVKGFRDAISTMEDSEAVNQVSLDIYNNDIEVGADDGIEADFTMGNARIMRNRITNSFIGISGQPTLGGPAYYVRNVMYNLAHIPFKLYRGSVGDVAFHNTVISSGDAFANYSGATWSRALFRNNLFIGGQGGGSYGGFSNGSGRIAQLSASDVSNDFNYDGYGSIGTGRFRGRIGSTSFNSLAEMRANTTEKNAIEVDMSIFANSIAFPSSGPFPALAVPDLRLASGGVAVNAGVALANVNDGYAGSAPDLGAYEFGDALPVYGPRPGRHPGYDSTDNTAPMAPTNIQIQ